jgi:Alpha-(1->3)-arabinofuranosyltransferase
MELIELLLLLVLGLVVFTWYSSNLIIDAFDYNLSFSPGQTLFRSLQLWDPHGGFGSAMPRVIAGVLPNNLYYAGMQFLGFSLHTSQSLLLYVILAGSGVSVFLLFRAFGLGEKYRNGAIFASIVYMFSPIASTFLWNQFASNYYSYCFIPLIAAAVVFGVRTRRGSFYIFGVVLLWTLLISASYMNPVNAFMDWVFIAGILGMLVFKESARRKQVIKFAAILMILWFLVNLFWILPVMSNVSVEVTRSGVSSVGVSNRDLLNSNSVPIYFAALQTGYWALYHDYLGDNWYSWSGLASSALFMFSCLIIAMTAFYAFFIRPRDPVIILLGVFTAFCLVMIDGFYPPTGYVLSGLFDLFPFLYAFRSLYQHFGPLLALSYSLLFGYSVAHIIGSVSWPRWKGFSVRRISLKAWTVMTWTVLVLLALSVIAIPYFTGQVIYEGGNVIPSARVQVPDYYYQANDFLNNATGDFRVLNLPYCQLGYASYSWENGYWGGDPLSTIFDKGVIVSEPGLSNELLVNMANQIANSTFHLNIGKMLSIMNVRYVMLHKDANWAFIQGQSPPWWAAPKANFSMYDTGLRNAGFTVAATLGGLVLYENPEWKEVHFLQVNQMVVVVGGIPAVWNLTEESWYDVSKMAFVVVHSLSDLANLDYHFDGIYYGRVLFREDSWKLQNGVPLDDLVGSPTLHRLIVDPTQRYVIFSERYDPEWTLTAHNGSTQEHIAVNMFFNGYILGNGTTDVTIEYQPQKGLVNLISFSVLFTVGTFVFLTYRHLRRGIGIVR